MHVTLLQPRYPHGRCQTYLPGSLMNLGSRLLSRGVEVSFIDLNHTNLNNPSLRAKLRSSTHIGFSVLGAPYIPVVADNIEKLRAQGFQQPIMVGGEGVVRLLPSDFSNWFGTSDVVQTKTDCEIEQALLLPHGSLPSMFETSMVSMLEQLSEQQRTAYLTKEFALFFSYGCKFNCRFCQAAKARREQYRTTESMRDEIEYICGYLHSIQHKSLRVYLSSLDIFQTPEKLEELLKCVHDTAADYGITVDARGLATSKCTVEGCRKDPELAHRLHHYGLEMASFGADGADEETWRRERKQHNSMSELDEAVQFMREARITPELLMVIGFPEDSWSQMWKAMKFSIRSALKGVIIRPYLAKLKTPGGLWEDEDPQVQAYRNDRTLLTKMDYAMCGSKETHPRWTQRLKANAAYLGMIGLLTPFRRCGTRPLFPIPKHGIVRKVLAKAANRMMPFDK